MERTLRIPWQRTATALLLFGTAFGYLEAAVVSYLRFLHEPVRHRFYPGRPPGDLFPLLTHEQAASVGTEQRKIRIIEIGREAATMLMLAGVGLAVAQNIGQWAAAFVVAFGTWDITFYLFLKVLLDWPGSPFTWDVLFIIPVAWAGPVIAPVLVSAAMIAAGLSHLRREATGDPVRLSGWNWTVIVVGALIIIVSFTLDHRNIMAGGMPHPFNWLLFGLGLLIGGLGYVSAAVGSRERRARAVTA